MAVFNPFDKPSSDPDYRKYTSTSSKLPVLGDEAYPNAPRAPSPRDMSDSTMGNLIQGIGGVVSGAVSVADTAIKSDIRDKITQGLDTYHKEIGVDQVAEANLDLFTSPDAKKHGKGLPPGVANIGETTDRIKEGYEAGQYGETYFRGRILSLAKSLRAQYPGYREEIDKTISNVLAVDPANKLRASIQNDMDRAAAARSSASDKQDAFVKQKTEWIDEPYMKRWMEKRDNFDQVFANAYQNERSAKRVQTDTALLHWRKARGEYVSEDAIRTFDLRASDMVDSNLSQVSTTQGVTKLGDLAQAAKEAAYNPNISSTDKVKLATQIETAAQEMRIKLYEEATKVHTDPNTGQSYSVASLINDENKLKAQIDRHVEKVQAYGRMLGKGDFTAIALDKNVTDLHNNEVERRLVEGTNLSRVKVISKYAGDAAVSALSIPGSAIGNEMTRTIVGAFNFSLREGNTQNTPKAIVPLVDSLTQNGMPGAQIAQVVNGATDTAVELVLSSKTPTQEKANMLYSLFRPENEQFLDRIAGTEGKYEMFSKIASPKIYEEIKKLNDPKLTNAYTQWTMRSFTGLLKLSVDSINTETSRLFGKDVQLRYDPESNTVTSPDRFYYDPQLRDLNAGLKIVEPVLKDMGANRGKFMFDLLKTMGLDNLFPPGDFGTEEEKKKNG